MKICEQTEILEKMLEVPCIHDPDEEECLCHENLISCHQALATSRIADALYQISRYMPDYEDPLS